MDLVVNPFRFLSIIIIVFGIYKISPVVRAIAFVFEGWSGTILVIAVGGLLLGAIVRRLEQTLHHLFGS